MARAAEQPERPDDGLSPEQQLAVEHTEGPLIVLAGPGTGKTRVITHRVAHMIRERGIEPESIVAVTFTVKAAEQMRDRLRELVGSSAADRVWASTFHAMGLRVLQRFGDTLKSTADAETRRAAQRIAADFRVRRGGRGGGMSGGIGTLIDSAQQKRILRRVIRDLDVFRPSRAYGLEYAVGIAADQIAAWSEMAVSPERAAEFGERWREHLAQGRSSAGADLDEGGLAAERERLAVYLDGVRAFAVYEAALGELGLLSFADLINLPTRLLSDPESRAGAIVRDEWRHVVVDEFQDANPAQIEMLRALAPPSAIRPPDLCVVGDDDQSIYGFRGADDRAFTRMSHLWGESIGRTVRVLELADNYRSAAPIVQLSSAVIARAHSRFKPDKSVRPAGSGDGAFVPTPTLAVGLSHDSFDAQAVAALVRLYMHEFATKLEQSASDPERSIDPPTFAVVVRSNNHTDSIAAALRQEGITVRTAHVGAATDDPGVQDVMAWWRVLTNPGATVQARRLLARPPVRLGPEVIGRLERAFEAATEADDPSAHNGYLAFIASCPDELLGPKPEHARAAVARLVDVQARLAPAVAAEPACEVVRRIITATGVSHAELMSPQDRAARVQALVAVLRFAMDVQSRLDEPGDLQALLAYYDDLSDQDQGLGSSGAWGDIEERLDGPRVTESVGVDGLSIGEPGESNEDGERPLTVHTPVVTILTAHKAKGLEFDVVFVPRLGRLKGQYSATGKSDHDDDDGNDLMPAGLMSFVHPGDRAARSAGERIEDEARRLFYVACTRAKRRLVLLSKQNKGRASGMHLFEEVLEHERPAGLIEAIGFQDVMRRAAEADVLHATSVSESDLDDSGGDDEHERLDRARRDVRLFAAEALDLCEHAGRDGTRASPGSSTAADIASAIERLTLAAQRMRALGGLASGYSAGKIEPTLLNADDRYISRLARRLASALGRVSEDDGTGHVAEPDGTGTVAMFTPGLKPPLRLSFSQINEYVRCPRCYYLRRVLGLPEQEGAPEVVGRVVHKAIELFTRKARGEEADLAHLTELGVDHSAPADLSMLRAIGHAVFRKAWPTNEPVDKDQLEQVDILLANFLCEFWRPDDHTVEIEHKITFDYTPSNTPPARKRSKNAKSVPADAREAPAAGLSGDGAVAQSHTIQAVIDRVDLVTLPDGTQADRMIDYKTGRDWKQYTEPKDEDLQMGIYALALADERGIDPADLRGTAEYWLVAGRTRGVLDLSQLRLDKVRHTIDKAIAGMLSGHFPIGKDHAGGRHGLTDCRLFEPEPRAS
ncbi:MAG: ATP-dependent helicase [Phycisphaeraceae bacterium]|nr:ATP-dependent helicase [Phycisphaeraceae bacterium]